jgi:poly(3-hydroxyalkanoate) depolymerase
MADENGDGLAPARVSLVQVGKRTLRVAVRPGSGAGPPLLIFNGVGANLELLETFTAALAGIETVAFDVPGVGGSPAPPRPYRFAGLARLAERLMSQLGYVGPFDVLGVSWGGALAQQFAHQFPQRCRRLVLAATSPGALMVPGRLSVLRRMISPRRYSDPDYLARFGAEIYGGDYRRRPELLREHSRHIRPPRGRGYYFQLLAAAGWSSLFWLRSLRQPTLVLAGRDDPIVPLVNARILALMIRDARLHIVDDGHLFLLSRATELAPVIRRFLAEGTATPAAPPDARPADCLVDS